MSSEAYKPELLIKAKLQIIKQHTKVDYSKAKAENNKEEKEFLEKIVKMSPDKLEKYSKMLSDDKIWLIVYYVTSNYYKLELANLLAVIDYVGNSKHMWTLLKEWENKTNAKDVKNFLEKEYAYNDAFEEALKDNNVDYKNLSWINESNLIEYLCKEIGKGKDIDSFLECMNSHGVIDGTELQRVCKSKFILYCNANSYKKIGDVEVASCFEGLKDYLDKIQLCANICLELNDKELFSFESLAVVVERFYKNTMYKEKLLARLRKECVCEKFELWMIKFTIDNFFGAYDDVNRREFWGRYIYSAKDIQSNYYALYIDFGDYVITEYKEQAGGCMYLFTKQFFESTVRHKFTYWEKNDYRKKMNFYYESSEMRKQGFVGKYKHLPVPDPYHYYEGWKNTFSSTLEYYGIRGVK